MKNIFLLAKYYAHNESAKKIEVVHIKKALESIKIEDNKAQNIIYAFLELKENIPRKILNNDYTKDAQKIDKISFSGKVKELKTELEKSGFYFTKDISSLLLAEQLHVKKEAKHNIFKKIKTLKAKLSEKVFAQEMAIESICDRLSEAEYIKNEKSPKAIMFFLGPPATGKTYLPEVLADNLDEYKLNIFDMSTYSSANQGFALFGLSKGYGTASEGKLTKFVSDNPKSIIVLDEVEKAHPAVLQNFLYLLSQGEVKDEFTQKMVSFRESILIFTSNLGSELYSNRVFLQKLKNNNSDAQSMLLDVISRETKLADGHSVKVLSPEFLSRLSQGESYIP